MTLNNDDMENGIPGGPLPERPGGGRVEARRVSLMSCLHAEATGERRHGLLILTLGNEDASVDHIGFNIEEGKTLLHRIALALGREKLLLGPANDEKVLRRWVVPHAVARAAVSVEGSERQYLIELKRDMPEVADYVEALLAGLRLILLTKGKSAATPDTVVKRVMRILLVAVDSARTGT